MDISAGGLFVLEGIIHPVVSVSALKWLLYIFLYMFEICISKIMQSIKDNKNLDIKLNAHDAFLEYPSYP
jgi:hypothetical protein